MFKHEEQSGLHCFLHTWRRISCIPCVIIKINGQCSPKRWSFESNITTFILCFKCHPHAHKNRSLLLTCHKWTYNFDADRWVKIFKFRKMAIHPLTIFFKYCIAGWGEAMREYPSFWEGDREKGFLWKRKK